MCSAGFKVHFSPAQEGVALEDFNGQPIWDASWGEADYGDEEEIEESAPWGQTDKKPASFLQLPEEDTLKEREEVSNHG